MTPGPRCVSLHSTTALPHHPGERKPQTCSNRVARGCSDTPNAVLISIHQNSLPEAPTVHGAQVFYGNGELGRPLATADPGVADVLRCDWSIRETKRDAGRNSASSLPHEPHAHCPAILVECGFLSNPAEDRACCAQTPISGRLPPSRRAVAWLQYRGIEILKRQARTRASNEGERQLFYCTECGNETPKWAGKCPACGAWNSIVERPAERSRSGKSSASRSVGLGPRRARPITDLEAEEEEVRFLTGMGELDRVLGGGAVKGSLVLVGGAPGIGKSTLMLQICSNLCRFSKVLYVSGEESEHQLKLRARRLRAESDQLFVLSETCLGDVLETVTEEQTGYFDH